MRVLVALYFILSLSTAANAAGGSKADDFESWLRFQRQFAENRILDNISPPDARRGAVIASPSRHNPNYYFHWVRDAALTMDIWMRQLEGFSGRIASADIENMMWDYLNFTDYNQLSPALSGLGEPRYEVQGQANLEPWGRPQNDGPALRASVFIRFANYLISKGQISLVYHKLWPVIENDLRYTGDEINALSFDLWEEVKGDHFYTRVICREALMLGSELAAKLNEHSLSAWYSTQAKIAESLALDHISPKEMQIIENTHRVDGIWYKNSGLDIASILALLHTPHKPLLSLNNNIVANTVIKIQQSFRPIYSINKKFPELGTAIGRYPEDIYYNGNPWFLATFALAEYYYRLGDRETGDSYMKRGRFHADRAGHMSEQMEKEHGFMLSAGDLTWSYAAFLTALEARQKYTSEKK